MIYVVVEELIPWNHLKEPICLVTSMGFCLGLY